MAEQQEAPFDIKQAAAYLNVTERFMRDRVYEKRIPFYKVGDRLLRFRRADLDAFLEAGRVDVAPDGDVITRAGRSRKR